MSKHGLMENTKQPPDYGSLGSRSKGPPSHVSYGKREYPPKYECPNPKSDDSVEIVIQGSSDQESFASPYFLDKNSAPINRSDIELKERDFGNFVKSVDEKFKKEWLTTEEFKNCIKKELEFTVTQPVKLEDGESEDREYRISIMLEEGSREFLGAKITDCVCGNQCCVKLSEVVDNSFGLLLKPVKEITVSSGPYVLGQFISFIGRLINSRNLSQHYPDELTDSLYQGAIRNFLSGWNYGPGFAIPNLVTNDMPLEELEAYADKCICLALIQSGAFAAVSFFVKEIFQTKYAGGYFRFYSGTLGVVTNSVGNVFERTFGTQKLLGRWFTILLKAARSGGEIGFFYLYMKLQNDLTGMERMGLADGTVFLTMLFAWFAIFGAYALTKKGIRLCNPKNLVTNLHQWPQIIEYSLSDSLGMGLQLMWSILTSVIAEKRLDQTSKTILAVINPVSNFFMNACYGLGRGVSNMIANKIKQGASPLEIVMLMFIGVSLGAVPGLVALPILVLARKVIFSFMVSKTNPAYSGALEQSLIPLVIACILLSLQGANEVSINVLKGIRKPVAAFLYQLGAIGLGLPLAMYMMIRSSLENSEGNDFNPIGLYVIFGLQLIPMLVNTTLNVVEIVKFAVGLNDAKIEELAEKMNTGQDSLIRQIINRMCGKSESEKIEKRSDIDNGTRKVEEKCPTVCNPCRMFNKQKTNLEQLEKDRFIEARKDMGTRKVKSWPNKKCGIGSSFWNSGLNPLNWLSKSKAGNLEAQESEEEGVMNNH